MINLLMKVLTILCVLGIVVGGILGLVMWACKGQDDY